MNFQLDYRFNDNDRSDSLYLYTIERLLKVVQELSKEFSNLAFWTAKNRLVTDGPYQFIHNH